MNILDTQTLTWNEISKFGVWPCTRHSHSMVAIDSQLFMFGGYDGQKALGDLYSFDINTLQWKTEKTTGRAPYSRFSHSMFAYKNYLGIIGGCPVRQQHQELSLLNLANNVWVHVTIGSFSRELWVRSSACLVNDELVIIGGGASCYAFGTKFNEPMKINLQLLESICEFPPEAGSQPAIDHNNKKNKKDSTCNYFLQGTSPDLEPKDLSDKCSKGNGNCADYKFYVLQIKKRYAKFAKDMTKKFGFLDLSRKVCPSPDGCYILLPITSDFHSLLLEKQLTQKIGSGDLDHFYQHDESQRNDLSVNEITVSNALNVLLACGVSLVTDDVPCNKMLAKSPQKMMKELLCSLLTQKGMSLHLLQQLPTRFDFLLHVSFMVLLTKNFIS